MPVDSTLSSLARTDTPAATPVVGTAGSRPPAPPPLETSLSPLPASARTVRPCFVQPSQHLTHLRHQIVEREVQDDGSTDKYDLGAVGVGLLRPPICLAESPANTIARRGGPSP